jgi:hypothetical protein
MTRRRREPQSAADVMDTVASLQAFLIPPAEDLPFVALARKAVAARYGTRASQARERFLEAWGANLRELVTSHDRSLLLRVVSAQGSGQIDFHFNVVSEPLLPSEVRVDAADVERAAPGLIRRLRHEALRHKEVRESLAVTAATLQVPVARVAAAVSPAYRGMADMPLATPAFQKRLYVRMAMGRAAEVERWFAEAVMLGRRHRGRGSPYGRDTLRLVEVG